MESTNNGARLVRHDARVLIESCDLSSLGEHDRCEIGRSPHSMIRIDENAASISREHAVIQRYGNGFSIEPRRNGNVVYVNGVLVPYRYPCKLLHQDNIAFITPIDTFLIYIDPSHKSSIIEYDPITITVRINGQPVRITGKEMELCLYLMRHMGKVVSHQELIETIWADERTDKETEFERLHKAISRLRVKIEKYTRLLEVKNVRDAGYQLTEQDEGPN